MKITLELSPTKSGAMIVGLKYSNNNQEIGINSRGCSFFNWLFGFLKAFLEKKLKIKLL